MRFVALAFAAATFIGASCPNPAPLPPDVVTDSQVDQTAPPSPVCRCKPCPAPDASCPIADAAPPNVDAAPTPIPPPPKPPSCATACDAMAKAGCKEGTITDCAERLCTVNADPRFRHYDTACLTNATTPGAVRACGIACIQ